MTISHNLELNSLLTRDNDPEAPPLLPRGVVGHECVVATVHLLGVGEHQVVTKHMDGAPLPHHLPVLVQPPEDTPDMTSA